jgi:cyanophycinase
LILVSLFAVVASTSSRAQENPFGLPEALDPSRLGSIMLHGGGFGLNDDIRQEFVRLAGGRDAHILLIPSDMSQRGRDSDGQLLSEQESKQAYERRLAEPREYGRWVTLKDTGQVADFQFLYWDDAEVWNDAAFYSLLSEATGVWIPAYDQEWLPKRFADEYPKKTSRFQSALRDVVARGGVVGGLGGGMASLPETIIAGTS